MSPNPHRADERTSPPGPNPLPIADEHVFLIGRPPLGEFLSFVSVSASEGESIDQRALANEWRDANDHVNVLESKEAGAADNPPCTPLPKRLAFLEQQIRDDVVFQRSFQVVPVTIGMIEVDRLVVFQKQINLAHVAHLRRSLGDHPSEEDVLRLCLPFDHPLPPVRAMRTAQNAYTFISPSNDLRFLEPVLFGGDQLAEYNPPGVPTGIIGLSVGFGANYLNAIQAEGRLVLNNGSHRAYALREHGVNQIPCVVQHVSRREELEMVVGGDVAAHPDLYLKSPRPPMLKDYFDSKLRKLVLVPRKARQVTVQFGVQFADIPA